LKGKTKLFFDYLRRVEAAAKTTRFFSTAAAKRKYFPINFFLFLFKAGDGGP
jgi:hypothetical protein